MRCLYCMPDAEYTWLPHESILTFEEIARLVRVFAGVGVTDVRLTGGEPLLRRDLPSLVALLRRERRLTDLSLTTNGILLSEAAAPLRHAGLDRVTVSLDTLRPERLVRLARSARHRDILAGIAAARRAGLDPVKINTVLVRGFNDDELEDLIAFARAEGVEVRFIEYMDVGGATRWTADDVVTRQEILEVLSRSFGTIVSLERASEDDDRSRPPADRFRLPDGYTFGVIASVTAPFCDGCDRSRLTADGTWFTCLYAEEGVNLREPLRSGAPDEEIAALISDVWRGRADRGAEERRGLVERSALYQIAGAGGPHREMHTRGG